MLFINKLEKARLKSMSMKKKGYMEPLSEVSITETVVESSKYRTKETDEKRDTLILNQKSIGKVERQN